MAYNNMMVNEMVEKAIGTRDLSDMVDMVKSPYMLVRRALAKNIHTPQNLINILSMDPVLNVSFPASTNPKSTIIRNFDEEKLPPCVTCKIAENKLLCRSGCKRKEDHSF